MRKAVLIAMVLAFVSGPAFAAYDCDGNVTLGSGTGTTMDVQVSKNVCLDYDAGTGGATFSAATYNTKGTRTYASSSGDSKIYYTNGTNAGLPSAPAVGSTMDISGWQTL